MVSIGECMREIRKQRGLKQQEVAEVMTVNQSYISQVENGKTKPTLMFIKLFCLQYGIDENMCSQALKED